MAIYVLYNKSSDNMIGFKTLGEAEVYLIKHEFRRFKPFNYQDERLESRVGKRYRRKGCTDNYMLKLVGVVGEHSVKTLSNTKVH